ncbi:MAG: 2-succinyl-6-hydroxy-2,4-cyclohexadiene-1-carboxylate synthase [Bacteroidetes bacterium]|nr:2-succinyl-6-hydroxy-2,4-cyclohexadiene-1-carboxylate synthase [Bacteroidota bacterium]
MKLKIGKVTCSVNKKGKSSSKNIILFLHGFAGSSKDWTEVISHLPKNNFIVTIDLIGHGKSSSPKNKMYYNEKALITQLFSVIKKTASKNINLIGYSLGGRLALSFSIKYPKIIKTLILESSTAGLTKKNERKRKRIMDKFLSNKLKKDGIKKFIHYWFEQPLFKNLKKHKNYKNLINKRLKNNKFGISNILTEFSQGKMKSMWSAIKHIETPMLLITGEKDRKYKKINSRMAKKLQKAKHVSIKNAGHNTHFEKPKLFANFVEKFLNSQK